MVRLIGVPKTLGDAVKGLSASSWFEVVWKVLFSALVLFVIVGIVSVFTIVGGVLASIIIGVIAADEIAAVLKDGYERRWASVDLSRLWPFAVAVLCVGSLVAVPAPTTADGVVNLPATPLDQQADEYEQSGEVTVQYQRVDAAVTVADGATTVGLDGLRWTDFDHTYVRINYDEGVSRTLRLRVPETFVRPRPKDGLEAANSDVTADLQRTNDGTATIMELQVEGPTDVVFPLSAEAGIVFDVRDGVRSLVANETGIPIPSISSTGDWTVVNDSLQPQSTYRIAHGEVTAPVSIQYDGGTIEEPQWLPIAPCDTENTPICELESASNDTQTTVLARSDEPPRMRYQVDAGLVAQARGALNDALAIPGRISNTVSDILSGVPFL